MLYQAYAARRALTKPVFAAAGAQTAALDLLPAVLAQAPSGHVLRAVSETVQALEITHRRPAFGIESALVGGAEVAVSEERMRSTSFGTLVRFAKDGATAQPRVLIVPGLAGHFGTLVRDTVRTLLPDHEVYVADWHNARDVPPSAGRFGLDDYIGHVVDFVAEIGPGTHVMAVCQPCVPVLAAAAIMAEDDHPAAPQSLILMAGPVDARVNPGRVNEFAGRVSPTLLGRTAIQTVPWPYRGAGRRVYPGFIQVMGFMSMDPQRHMRAFFRLFRDVLRDDREAADRTQDFYDEYFAVLDVTAEFYLDTLKVVFTEHEMARGRMEWRGRHVNASAFRRGLFTIEAEKDEICPPGQTSAAHLLCPGVPAHLRRSHVQAGVGHYGVFSGSRFEREIYPRIRDFIAETGAA